jgi:hypothetical protein
MTAPMDEAREELRRLVERLPDEQVQAVVSQLRAQLVSADRRGSWPPAWFAVPVAIAIAAALGIPVDELAGVSRDTADLSGDWWFGWQSVKDGGEVTVLQQVRLKRQGDEMQVQSLTRGCSVEDGGYHWRADPLGRRPLGRLVRRGRGWRAIEGEPVLPSRSPGRAPDRSVGRPVLPQACRPWLLRDGSRACRRTRVAGT